MSLALFSLYVNVLLVVCSSEPDTENQQCWKDLEILRRSSNSSWVIKFWDSWGRPTSGILGKRHSWPGSYRECKTFKHEILEEPNGSLHLETPRQLRGRFCWVNGAADMEWKEKMGVKIGACLPDSCTSKALRPRTNVIKSFLEMSHSLGPPLESFNLSSFECEVEAKVDSYLLGFLGLMFLLVLLVSLCTVADYYLSNYSTPKWAPLEAMVLTEHLKGSSFEELPDQMAKNRRNSDSTIIQRFVGCFSVVRNAQRLSDMSPSKSPQTECLHGIRALAMVSIMIAHSTSIFIDHGDSQGNMYNLIQSSTVFGYLFIKTGLCSVDTFFLLSGFLLTFIFFSEIEKRQTRMNWVLYYVHRYFRLTPSMLVVSFGYVALLPFLGSGPFWTYTSQWWHQFCKENWWKNFFYVGNLINGACAGWLWYLAVDMQLYVVSPIYLIMLQKRPKLGVAAIIVTVLVCDLATTFIAYHFRLDATIPYPTADHYDKDTAQFSQMRGMIFGKLYMKPYARAGPYGAGLLAGYGTYLFTVKGIAPSKFQVWLGWILAVLCTVYMLAGLVVDTMPVEVSSLYNGLSHTAWGLAISWLAYACTTGNGGWFNGFLSGRLWRLPSRLTYCAYLVHPIVMYWFYFSYKNTLIMTKEILTINSFGFILLSYMLAFAVTLLVESPLLALEKLLLRG